jgi:rhomboid protease GluP
MANCVQCGRQMPGLSFGKKLCSWCVQHEAAQRGEDSPIQRVEIAPWMRSQSSSMVVTQVFFGINVAVFVAMTLAGVSVTSPTTGELWHWGANYGPLTIGGEWWRLLTCVFLHIGIIHIAFNMWCLWGLGRMAESVYGHGTFAGVYLITGVAASVTSLAWNPAGTSAGASGAIFGIAGALIASFYLGEFSMPRVAVSGLLRNVLMFAGYNLLFGAMSGRTDNAAHVGGLVSGLILGALIAKVAPLSEDIPQRVAVFVVVILLVYGGAAWLHHSQAYQVHASRGSALLEGKNPDAAIAELKAAVQERPTYLPAHYDLARAYWQKSDLASAEVELKRVLALDPKAEEAYFYLGWVYLERNQMEPARESFNAALRLNPQSAPGHSGLGEVLLRGQRYSEALEEFKLTAKLDPEFDGIAQDMGTAEAGLKQYDAAIASFLKQKIAGDNAGNESDLAKAYEAKGMTAEAEQARQVASKLRE